MAYQFQKLTGLAFKSEHEGQMHACGHDVHMTVAIGLLRNFVENPINDHIVIIFQPAEEGPGGAFPMREWLKVRASRANSGSNFRISYCT